MLNIVFVDADTLGERGELDFFEKLGKVTKYPHLWEHEVSDKVVDADVIVSNKVPMNEKTLHLAKNLKLICVAATGINNLDLDYLNQRGIAWRNVAGYSTHSVAENTLAQVLYLEQALPFYDRYVKDGAYAKSPIFTKFGAPYHELAGRTWGIIGMGAIGQAVAKLAEAFGCQVIYFSTSGKNTDQPYEQVSFDELLERSDYVTVHAPLNDQTMGLMNREAFKKMKKDAIFVNVGRGPIVVEEDLAEALQQGEIKAAGLDVLCVEPIREDNPLLQIKDSTKLLITPHIAWASVEARYRLLHTIYGQIQEFFGIGE